MNIVVDCCMKVAPSAVSVNVYIIYQINKYSTGDIQLSMDIKKNQLSVQNHTRNVTNDAVIMFTSKILWRLHSIYVIIEKKRFWVLGTYS